MDVDFCVGRNGKFKMQETSSGGPEIPRIQRLQQSS